MKTILFPFKIDQNNNAAYAKAMDMAQQIGAKVIFFTSLPDASAAEKDKAYFHLLELNGDYQTNHNNWQATLKVRTERHFVITDFDQGLKGFLESTPVDWIVPTAAIKNGFSATYAQSPSLVVLKNTTTYYPNLSAACRRV